MKLTKIIAENKEIRNGIATTITALIGALSLITAIKLHKITIKEKKELNKRIERSRKLEKIIAENEEKLEALRMVDRAAEIMNKGVEES